MLILMSSSGWLGFSNFVETKITWYHVYLNKIEELRNRKWNNKMRWMSIRNDELPLNQLIIIMRKLASYQLIDINKYRQIRKHPVKWWKK